VDTLTAYRIALWDGSDWSNLGGLGDDRYDDVYAITEYDGDIVAAGNLPTAQKNVAAWQSSSWVALGDGLSGPVKVLHVHDGDLYAGGSFEESGALDVNHVAGWDGSDWFDLDGGMRRESLGPVVWALASFDGDLIVGGEFDSAGTVPANNIARWDGADWYPLGSGAGGVNGAVRCLTVFDGDLLVAGDFDSAAGLPMGIARWDGASWSPFACFGGASHRVEVMVEYDTDSYIGDLVVAGTLTSINGVPVDDLARWNGSEWRPFGGGLARVTCSNYPRTAATLFDGALCVGGTFSAVGEGGAISSRGIAFWDEDTLTGVEPTREDRTTEFLNVEFGPNPTSQSTSIMYDLPARASVSVGVFDITGRRVATLVEEVQGPGRYSLVWEGRSATGAHVGSGIFFLRVAAGELSATRKLVLTR
jgi:hypothetical protein